MRLDLQDSNGMTPTRPSASTHAAMTTSSSSGKMVTTGTSTMGEHTFGDEVEVHTLLVIDQHTFEGKYECFCYFLPWLYVRYCHQFSVYCHWNSFASLSFSRFNIFLTNNFTNCNQT